MTHPEMYLLFEKRRQVWYVCRDLTSAADCCILPCSVAHRHTPYYWSCSWKTSTDFNEKGIELCLKLALAVLHETVYSKVCRLPRVTRSWFLRRHYCCINQSFGESDKSSLMLLYPEKQENPQLYQLSPQRQGHKQHPTQSNIKIHH